MAFSMTDVRVYFWGGASPVHLEQTSRISDARTFRGSGRPGEVHECTEFGGETVRFHWSLGVIQVLTVTRSIGGK